MRLHIRIPRRHVPTLVTALIVLWLGAVCAYTVLGGRAPAESSGAGGMIRTALNVPEGRAPSTPVIAAELRSATSSETGPEHEQPRDEKRDEPKDPERKKHRRDRKRGKHRKHKKPSVKVVPGHALPVSPKVAAPWELRKKHHDYPAIDLLVRTGTKVHAVTAGRVKDMTGGGACGKGLIIRGKDGFTYTYCHGIKRFVGRGKWVDAGEPILASGNTGNSSAPHLHLQISRPNGSLVCPQDLLPAWRKGVRKSPWKAGRRGCHR